MLYSAFLFLGSFMIPFKNIIPLVALGAGLVLVEMYFIKGENVTEKNEVGQNFELLDFEPYAISELKPFKLTSVQYGDKRVCRVKGTALEVLIGKLPKTIALECSHGPTSAEFVSFNGDEVENPILNLRFKY